MGSSLCAGCARRDGRDGGLGTSVTCTRVAAFCCDIELELCVVLDCGACDAALFARARAGDSFLRHWAQVEFARSWNARGGVCVGKKRSPQA